MSNSSEAATIVELEMCQLFLLALMFFSPIGDWFRSSFLRLDVPSGIFFYRFNSEIVAKDYYQREHKLKIIIGCVDNAIALTMNFTQLIYLNSSAVFR